MKSLHEPEIDRWRVRSGPVVRHHGGIGDETCGAFVVPTSINGSSVRLGVIATQGEGWDHVSVSTPTRCPKWEEMEYIKRLFFRDDETAMQLHVPPADHKNCHEFCLHLWRPQDGAIPRPPSILVAP